MSEIEHLDLSQRKYKNERLISDLEINDDEQKQLKTIISTSEKRRRKNNHRSKVGRSKDIAKRHVKSGQKKRKKTLRNKKAITMYKKGFRISTISKQLKITRHTVYKAIRERQ